MKYLGNITLRFPKRGPNCENSRGFSHLIIDFVVTECKVQYLFILQYHSYCVHKIANLCNSNTYLNVNSPKNNE